MATVELVISPDPPGTNTYTGEAKVVGVTPSKVEFWDNGVLLRTESAYPYALFGDAGGVLNKGRLGTGTHQVQVRAIQGTTVVASVTREIVESAVSDPRQTSKQKLLALGFSGPEADVTVNP